jgi:leucyl-tRNA synthetase
LIGKYDPTAIEEKWKSEWASGSAYEAPKRLSNRGKRYVLEFFPYPSGSGLSVGHLRNYVAGDVVARRFRMMGYDVLHPMGWDAFGLPAENRARADGRHPDRTTRAFAATYRRQLELVSCGYDWSRELFSSDPEYYRWTQWLFLVMYRRGLDYRGTSLQWWCPDCETVLANEQIGGDEAGPRCWRCERAVERREVSQWFLRISDYAQRLLDDLSALDWPEGILAMQRQWIGRSVGTRIEFELVGSSERIAVFTTRPDTLFGASAVVLAPESELSERLATSENRAAVEAYCANCRRTAETARRSADRPVTGVFTGSYARNPLTNTSLPIWVADYVLPDYGSGAIMAVPAHDERDARFAAEMHLPVIRVVAPHGEPGDAAVARADGVGAFTGRGRTLNSGKYTGLTSDAAADAITNDLAALDRGGREVRFRLRDWSISRQRFWGAPIPIVHCDRCGQNPVPEAELPVRLPDVERVPRPTADAAGRPVSPLASVPSFVEARCPACGGAARRESDTLDGFACSSWYFFRFADPRNETAPFGEEAAAGWMPVDLYIGGAEHAVMHLLYARFWTKVLYDAGLSPVEEPFPCLRNQGMILDSTGKKMSKSRPDQVVTPDEAVDRYGADSVRAYEMFIAPFDQDVVWQEDGLSGVSRWLRRVWRVAHLTDSAADVRATDRHLMAATHRAIEDVTRALDDLRFNVAVARLMELTNVLVDHSTRHPDTFCPVAPGRPISSAKRTAWNEAVDSLLLLMAPITPHIAAELWERRGRQGAIHEHKWPTADMAILSRQEVEIALQVDGVVRARTVIDCEWSVAELRQVALTHDVVQRWIAGRTVDRVIVVPDRLVNIVTAE